MGKYLLMLALFQLGLSSVVEAADSDSVPVTFGGLKIFPALEVTEEYNSNVFQADTTDVQTSSLVTKLSPSLEIGIDSKSTQVIVHYQFDKGIYKSAGVADYGDQTATLKGVFGVTKRLNISTTLAYKKDHEMRGVSQVAGVQTLIAPDKLTKTTVQGQASYGIRGRIDIEGNYVSKRYDDLLRGKAVDVDTMNGLLALSFPIRSKARALLEARYTSNNFIYNLNNLDNNEQSYYLGLDWDNKSKTTGSLRLGYLLKSYDNFSSDSFISWELDAGWKLMSTSTLNFKTSFKPVGSDAEYGYVTKYMNGLSWEQEWSESLKQTVSIGYDKIRYKTAFSVAGVADYRHKETVISASYGVDYKMRRWLMLSGGYTFSNRTSNQATVAGIANPTFRQHILSFNLTGTM